LYKKKQPNNHPSPSLTEHKKKDIWRWKSRSWLGKVPKM